jgi:hypothetical protein
VDAATASRARSLVEVKLGKLGRAECLARLADMGLDGGEAASVFEAALKKKRRACSSMMFWGAICCLLGIVVSAAMTGSDTYEYFYWYGIVLVGLGLIITGFAQRIRYGKS